MALQIEYINTEELVPYLKNTRLHSADQVDQIVASINEFGFTNPVLIDQDNVLIAGHGRTLAAQQAGLEQVPAIRLNGLSEAQRKALRIADNQLPQNATWDMDLLAEELQELDLEDFDLDLLGFDPDFLDDLLDGVDEIEDENEGDGEAAIPEPKENPVSVTGDIWLLGDNRVMCGDSTNFNDVDKLTNGEKAQLLHADPPYGMGKEGDGVANDNLYNKKLDKFQMDWWNTFRPFLTDNASAYIWGNAPDLWRLWFADLEKSEPLTMRNQIVWDKQTGQGMNSEQHRQYATSVECCLFFMVGEQGFNNNSDNYWDGFDPIREYLLEQRNLAGWNNKKVAEFFGFHPRMADHWFSKSQWSFPKKEQYERLQQEANGKAFTKSYAELKKGCDELKNGYDKLKQEFYKTRSYFDNTHEIMRDVWQYPRVTGEERHGHATPKPVMMMERVMKTSLPKKGLCLEPFGGSGSTLIAAQTTGRKCYTMELQEKYVDVIVKRWQNLTGKQARLESTGQTFAQVEQERQPDEAA